MWSWMGLQGCPYLISGVLPEQRSTPSSMRFMKDSAAIIRMSQVFLRKIVWQGYLWPTMTKDCADYVKKCDQCQRYAKVPRVPPTEINLMSTPWPFFVWGIDLVGSLPTGKDGVKYAIFAVDYSTKWVEAEPMNTITSKKALDFVIKNIVCRFYLPQKIISDKM